MVTSAPLATGLSTLTDHSILSYYNRSIVPQGKMTVPSAHSVSTTDMQVTSIRLERELKERLKTLAGHQGYQTLIRDVLWTYVQQKSGEYAPKLSPSQISASFTAVSHQKQYCAVTGQVIEPQEMMRLGFTTEGVLVPLSAEGTQGDV
jgi:uncharacterized protein (DUF4415 family)